MTKTNLCDYMSFLYQMHLLFGDGPSFHLSLGQVSQCHHLFLFESIPHLPVTVPMLTKLFIPETRKCIHRWGKKKSQAADSVAVKSAWLCLMIIDNKSSLIWSHLYLEIGFWWVFPGLTFKCKTEQWFYGYIIKLKEDIFFCIVSLIAYSTIHFIYTFTLHI